MNSRILHHKPVRYVLFAGFLLRKQRLGEFDFPKIEQEQNMTGLTDIKTLAPDWSRSPRVRVRRDGGGVKTAGPSWRQSPMTAREGRARPGCSLGSAGGRGGSRGRRRLRSGGDQCLCPALRGLQGVPPAPEGPPLMPGDQSQAQALVPFLEPRGPDQAGPCRAGGGKSQRRAGTPSRGIRHRRGLHPRPWGLPGTEEEKGPQGEVGRSVDSGQGHHQPLLLPLLQAAAAGGGPHGNRERVSEHVRGLAESTS